MNNAMGKSLVGIGTSIIIAILLWIGSSIVQTRDSVRTLTEARSYNERELLELRARIAQTERETQEIKLAINRFQLLLRNAN